MNDATPPRPRPPRRLALAGVAVVILAATVAVGRVAGSEGEPDHPTPARPGPGRGTAGLRLLVADAPAPFVLDVERGSVRTVRGLPGDGERGIGVSAVGGDALVVSTRFCDDCRTTGAYLVRRGGAVATRLGTALQMVPSRDGRGVWMQTGSGRGRCAVRELGLDGRPRRAARRVDCRAGLVAELPAGLLLSVVGGGQAYDALLGSDGGLVRLRHWQARPAGGNLVLTGADQGTPLVLRDLGSGARHRLRWPARPEYALAEVTPAPDGRQAVVGFARYSPRHRLDLWLLDLATRRWRHLPGMPASIVPKATDVEWTPDGRVVVLSGSWLAAWRPGDPELAVRRVRPAGQPGSQFVLW